MEREYVITQSAWPFRVARSSGSPLSFGSGAGAATQTTASANEQQSNTATRLAFIAHSSPVVRAASTLRLRNVPQFHRLVHAPRCERLAVRAEGDGPHCTAVPCDNETLSA